MVGGTTIFSGSYLFKVDDHNNSEGDPAGANPDAFWDAFSFDVRLVCSILLHEILAGLLTIFVFGLTGWICCRNQCEIAPGMAALSGCSLPYCSRRE